ncbi:MAG: hypothetical protein MZV70_05025 [Desulfobacterales bacterium]|nr:hypothetical protein [Desulfobacterales bacterium]
MARVETSRVAALKGGDEDRPSAEDPARGPPAASPSGSDAWSDASRGL